MISDRQMWWNRHRLWLPVQNWANGSIASNLTITKITKVAADMTYQGLMWDGGTSGHAASTVIQGKIAIPPCVNPEFPLGFRIHFVNQVTSSAACVTKPVILAAIKTGNTDVIADAAGALDTPIPVSTSATIPAGQFNISNRGIKNANWTTRSKIYSGSWLEFSLMWGTLTNYTLGTGAKLWVTGLMIDYVPMLTRFPHGELDAPEDDAMA
jgi:hypothetical protein